jgi:hypothetical protein
MTAEKVHAGIAVAMKQFAERGWEADVGLIRPDETAGPAVEHQLASKSYDCVVIGAGARLPPRRLVLFEAVNNAVHKAAPGATIAFIHGPMIAPMLPPGAWWLETGLDGSYWQSLCPPHTHVLSDGALGSYLRNAGPEVGF